MELVKELNTTLGALKQTLSSFPAEKFNTRPQADKWSAEQIIEHLIVVDKSILRLLRGETQQAERDPWEKVEAIRSVFENDSRSYSAPDPIKPVPLGKDLQGLSEICFSIRQKSIERAQTLDLALICMDFRHFHFGHLSRAEWLAFMSIHGERHRRQIERLA